MSTGGRTRIRQRTLLLALTVEHVPAGHPTLTLHRIDRSDGVWQVTSDSADNSLEVLHHNAGLAPPYRTISNIGLGGAHTVGASVLAAVPAAYDDLRVFGSTLTSSQLKALFLDRPAPLPPQGWIFVPPMTAEIGAPLGVGDSDDLPRHTVQLTRAFAMRARETTAAEYRAILPESTVSGLGSDAVTGVSWADAITFANTLTLDPANRCYSDDGSGVVLVADCTGYRLPTEAEWEVAARLGTTGELIGPTETTCDTDGVGPVGQLAPGPQGLYDVAGNAWELVWDADGAAPVTGVAVDPTGAFLPGESVPEGTNIVIRGGASGGDPASCRLSGRNTIDNSVVSPTVGFRRVRTWTWDWGQRCPGQPDEIPTTLFSDCDSDGYAAPGALSFQGIGCAAPAPDPSCPEGTWTSLDPIAPAAQDCNDVDPLIRPGVTEGVGDGVDQNCDGLEVCFADLDGDGFRTDEGEIVSDDLDCGDPGEAWSSVTPGDCCDSDGTTFPGQVQFFSGANTCNSFDYSCDGAQQRRWEAVGGYCGATCADQGAQAWQDSTAPACGEFAMWVESCPLVGFGVCTMLLDFKVQECR